MFMGLGSCIKCNDVNKSERPNSTIKFAFGTLWNFEGALGNTTVLKLCWSLSRCEVETHGKFLCIESVPAVVLWKTSN